MTSDWETSAPHIVISSEARNLCHSRSDGQCLELPNGKPAPRRLSGIALFILRGASIFLCAVPPFLISNFSFTRGFQIESKDGTPHWLTLPSNNNNNERTFYVLLISIRNDLSHFLCGRTSPCAAAASCTGQHLRDTDPVCPLILQGHPYPADPAGLHVPHRDHAHPLPSGRRRPHGLVAPDLLYPSAVHRDHHPCHGHRHGSRRPFHAVYHEEGHKEGDLP